MVETQQNNEVFETEINMDEIKDVNSEDLATGVEKALQVKFEGELYFLGLDTKEVETYIKNNLDDHIIKQSNKLSKFIEGEYNKKFNSIPNTYGDEIFKNIKEKSRHAVIDYSLITNKDNYITKTLDELLDSKSKGDPGVVVDYLIRVHTSKHKYGSEYANKFLKQLTNGKENKLKEIFSEKKAQSHPNYSDVLAVLNFKPNENEHLYAKQETNNN